MGRAPRVAAKELSLQPEVSGRRAYVAACNTHNDDWTRVHSGTFGIESYDIEVDKVNVAKTKGHFDRLCRLFGLEPDGQAGWKQLTKYVLVEDFDEETVIN